MAAPHALLSATVPDAVELADEEVTDLLSVGARALAVRAWEFGGAAALSVLEDEWAVEGETLVRARAALESAWDEDERPSLRAKGNRWTAVGTSAQVRLGRDGRWWPYRKERGRWVPAGGPAQDPATALASTEAGPEG